MTLSRRGFLGRLLGGAVAAVVAPRVLIDPERELWVPGAKTIVLPPTGGWMVPESVPIMSPVARRTLKVELFANAAGLYANGFNPMDPTIERMVQVRGCVYRVAQVELRRDVKELYGANQFPVMLARGFMKVEAELEEVFSVAVNTVPELRNYVAFEETVHYDSFAYEDPRKEFSMTRSSFAERERMREAVAYEQRRGISSSVDLPDDTDEDYESDWEDIDDDDV